MGCCFHLGYKSVEQNERRKLATDLSISAKTKKKLDPDYMRPVRLQIGFHTNACLHEAGLKNHFMPVSLIPVSEPTRMTQTGLKSDTRTDLRPVRDHCFGPF